MPLRSEEQLAAKAIHTFLTSHGRRSEWSPGVPDPPDLVFEVDGERWGIEVTRLFQYFSDGQSARSREAVAKPLSKLCQNLAAYAAAKAPTKGFWLIAWGPTTPSVSVIEKRGKSFIDGAGLGPERLDDKGLVTVEVTPRWQGLQYAHGLRGGTRSASGKTVSADIGQTLSDAMKKTVDDKAPRLDRMAGYDRKLLALVNDYFFATPENVRTAYENHRSTAFDAVIFIDGSVHVIDDPKSLLRTRS